MQRIQKAQVDHTAAVDDDNKVLIVRRHELQVLPLHIVQAVVALLIHAVVALAGLAGQHVQRRVAAGSCHIRLCDGDAGGMAEGRHGAEDLIEVLHALDPLLLLLPVGLIGVGIKAVKAIQPGRAGDLEACVYQPLLDGHAVAFPHRAGAGTSLDSHARTRTVEREPLFFQGQSTVIFEKNKALRRRLAGKRTVFQLQRGGFPQSGRLDDLHSLNSFPGFQASRQRRMGLPSSHSMGSQT